MRFTRIRTTRLASGQDAGAWSHSLEHLRDDGVRILKGPRGESAVGDRVLHLRLASRDVVLKLRPLGSIVERARHAIGASRLHRQWRGAELLKAAGIRTAEPLAIGVLRLEGRRYQWLATSFIEGPTLLHALAEARGGAAEKVLAVAAGRLVAALAHASIGGGSGAGGGTGLFNRDLKPSNVMLAQEFAAAIDAGRAHVGGGGGGAIPTPKLAIIDTVGILRMSAGRGDGRGGVGGGGGGGAREAAVARMLASLVIEPIGCGVAPGVWARRACVRACAETLVGVQRTLRFPGVTGVAGDRAGEGATARTAISLWRRARAVVEAHGDPTPKDNPLS